MANAAVHYGPTEFLCHALLNMSSRMGFYAPDSLIHEAEIRGIAVLGLDVNASRCSAPSRTAACASAWPTSRGRRPRR